MKFQAILTFDLEFWFNSQFLKKHLPKDKNSLKGFVEEPTELLLDLLNRYNQKATFFVLGQIAERYPKTIKRIFDLGHEIASHGYSHQLLNELGPREFEKEIFQTNQIIERITGQKPIGFRAPNFSLNHRTKWALKILTKYNFQYDSSISPLSARKSFNSSIIQIPPSLGGIYFRILPLGLYLGLIRYTTKMKPPVLYLHPYELSNSTPRIESAPWYKKKIKYWGTKGAWKKLEKLMVKFNFISIEKYLDENPPNQPASS